MKTLGFRHIALNVADPQRSAGSFYGADPDGIIIPFIYHLPSNDRGGGFKA
jgi:hypothetical protein